MKPLYITNIASSFLIVLFLLHASGTVNKGAQLSQNRGFPPAGQAMNATVKIETISQDSAGQQMLRTGTGAILHPDGIIITNYHNVAQAQDIYVTLHNHQTYLASLLQYNASKDLALLKVSGGEMTSLPLGHSASVNLGDKVYAIGNPNALDFSLTSGIVGGFNREVRIIEHPRAVERFIQTDVPINPGCSGGPLLNQHGQLIGIVTAISGQSGHFEGYSFAQPVDMVRELLFEADWLATPNSKELARVNEVWN